MITKLKYFVAESALAEKLIDKYINGLTTQSIRIYDELYEKNYSPISFSSRYSKILLEFFHKKFKSKTITAKKFNADYVALFPIELKDKITLFLKQNNPTISNDPHPVSTFIKYDFEFSQSQFLIFLKEL